MSGYSHTRLVYSASGVGIQYIDLTKGLALLNAKNCTQFHKDKPILVTGTVRMKTASESVQAAKNSWVVRNAAVKAVAAWRRTLRSAGIRRKKQLNTYAQDLRLAFDSDHSNTYGGLLGASGTACDIIPVGVDDHYVSDVFAASSATAIKVWAVLDLSASAFDANNVQAFTQTTFAVPQSGATDVLDKPANLIGGLSTTDSNIVAEYIDSRVNDAPEEDTDLDASPSIDNDFVMMLAPGEEVADDVLDNVDDEGKWRPYSLATHTSEQEIITPGNNVAGQDTPFEAPLGLLRWAPSENKSTLVIDIHGLGTM